MFCLYKEKKVFYRYLCDVVIFAENGDITQATVKKTKIVRDNRRVMVKLKIQRRRRIPKANKNRTNSQTH